MADSDKLTGKHALCRHSKSCIRNTFDGFARGAFIGLVLRAAITLFTAIIRRQLFKKPQVLLQIFKLDNLRVVAFLSMMVGSFRGTLCALRRWTNDETKASFGAGLIAGLPLAFEQQATRVTYAVYLFVRAMDSLIKHLVSIGKLPRVPLFYELCFIISTGYMHFVKTFDPECLNKGYRNVIGRLLIGTNDKFVFNMGAPLKQ